jgi:hypothetical protein
VIEEEKFVVDQKWWENANPKVKSFIETLSPNFSSSFAYPHTTMKQSKKVFAGKSWTEIYNTIYWKQIISYDFHAWATVDNPYLQPFEIIPIKDYDLKTLKSIAMRRILTNGTLKADDKEDLEGLISSIDTKLDPKTQKFMKLTGTSPKHDRSVVGYSRAVDFINDVTNDERCASHLDAEDAGFIIVKPWITINPKFEFRAFVNDGKVTAASQQFVYQFFEYSEEELFKIAKAIFESNVMKYLPFKEAILDLYWDEKEEKLMLIECNPFGTWASGGSSLFHWINDRDLLYGQKKPCLVVRKS